MRAMRLHPGLQWSPFEAWILRNAANYCGSGYRGGRKGMRGGEILVEGNVGDYCAECLFGGTVRVKGNAGIHAGANMKGGHLIIEGDALMPCGDMFAGVADIFGTVTDFLATFREKGTVSVEGHTLTELKKSMRQRIVPRHLQIV